MICGRCLAKIPDGEELLTLGSTYTCRECHEKIISEEKKVQTNSLTALWVGVGSLIILAIVILIIKPK